MHAGPQDNEMGTLSPYTAQLVSPLPIYIETHLLSLKEDFFQDIFKTQKRRSWCQTDTCKYPTEMVWKDHPSHAAIPCPFPLLSPTTQRALWTKGTHFSIKHSLSNCPLSEARDPRGRASRRNDACPWSCIHNSAAQGKSTVLSAKLSTKPWRRAAEMLPPAVPATWQWLPGKGGLEMPTRVRFPKAQGKPL